MLKVCCRSSTSLMLMDESVVFAHFRSLSTPQCFVVGVVVADFHLCVS